MIYTTTTNEVNLSHFSNFSQFYLVFSPVSVGLSERRQTGATRAVCGGKAKVWAQIIHCLGPPYTFTHTERARGTSNRTNYI